LDANHFFRILLFTSSSIQKQTVAMIGILRLRRKRIPDRYRSTEAR
jgi:hypothetical protein